MVVICPAKCRFSILWRIDLVFGGVDSGPLVTSEFGVSVSSGGSTWFLGFSASRSSRSAASFSILWRIDLVFGALIKPRWRPATSGFQYPLADRLGFWGYCRRRRARTRLQFQYPLADRLGFWGMRCPGQACRSCPAFQYPLADRLGFWGPPPNDTSAQATRFSILWRIDLVFGASAERDAKDANAVSVSSGGSTWFLGLGQQILLYPDTVFQYPLADRLGFWGIRTQLDLIPLQQFQYPLADRLGFWGVQPLRELRGRRSVSVSSGGSTWFLGGQGRSYHLVARCFSILWRIDLVFGALPTTPPQQPPCRFSILWRIDLVFGASRWRW